MMMSSTKTIKKIFPLTKVEEKLAHERNSRIFEDKEQSLLHIQESFVGLLFDCSWFWGFTPVSSLADFVVFFNVWLFFLFFVIFPPASAYFMH
jgi:hypothetical protein